MGRRAADYVVALATLIPELGEPARLLVQVVELPRDLDNLIPHADLGPRGPRGPRTGALYIILWLSRPLSHARTFKVLFGPCGPANKINGFHWTNRGPNVDQRGPARTSL